MSYFNASNTGANHVYNGQTIYASTLLMHDIAAVQRLYGVNTNFATGNTVYGANSNAAAAYHITNSSQQVVFCIWDGGGTDTLDCSIYSTSQVISLIPGSFSNVGALTYNVSIAEGTIIENAIGGSGNDTLYGNEVGNYLAGGD
jgi:serralysin